VLESIGVLGSDVAVQAVAGITGAASLGAFVVAHLASPPSPCWKGKKCMLKAADETACGRCSVYLRTRGQPDELALRGLPELGDIKRIQVIGALE
jgi:hypothetical protein